MTPLVVDNVRKHYVQGGRQVIALDGVSLAVEAHRFVAVMGASGSGKSTLLHLMAGLTTADGGRVLVNDVDLASMNDRQLTLFRRRHIGLVFQSFNLIPSLTARQNVALPLLLDNSADDAAMRAWMRCSSGLGLAGRAGIGPMRSAAASSSASRSAGRW
jgi:putative ABC transport system ATP-binding protein